jgi:hypothetical protein
MGTLEELGATVVAITPQLSEATVIQHAQRGGRPSPWLSELLRRKSPKLAAVALANKMARIAWKLMVTGENYAAKAAPVPGVAINQFLPPHDRPPGLTLPAWFALSPAGSLAAGKLHEK